MVPKSATLSIGEIVGRAWFPRDAGELDFILCDLLPLLAAEVWLVRVPVGVSLGCPPADCAEAGFACSLCSAEVWQDEGDQPTHHIIMACGCTVLLLSPHHLWLLPTEPALWGIWCDGVTAAGCSA